MQKKQDVRSIRARVVIAIVVPELKVEEVHTKIIKLIGVIFS